MVLAMGKKRVAAKRAQLTFSEASLEERGCFEDQPQQVKSLESLED
jgi:hypothetical protein